MRFCEFGMRIGRSAIAFVSASTFLAATSQLLAEPFVYTGRDLLLGFRQADSVSELIVNIGPASRYYGAAPGENFGITGFSSEQLNTAFSTLDGVFWSVVGTTRSADGGDPTIPNATIWATRPRLALGVQTAPWLRKSAFSQGGTANKINELGVNTTLLSDGTPADPLRNTATAIIEPAGEPRSFGVVMGPQGNLKGNFQGNVEANTGIPFSQPIRSDIYEMRPGAGDLPGKYLGYFELAPSGKLSFTAAGGLPPQDPPKPTIESIVRAGGTTTLTFTTTNDSTVVYRIRSTNQAGLGTPLSAWNVSGASITGNGQARTLIDETTDEDRFYSISASR